MTENKREYYVKILQRSAYLQGYMHAFSLYPTGEKDDPWEDTRSAYGEIGSALWRAFLDEVLDLERYAAQGVADERVARRIGKSVKEVCERLGI